MQHRTIYFISTEDIIFVFQFMYGIQLLKKIGHHLKVLSINISVTSEHKHARFKVEDSIKIPFPTSLTFNFFLHFVGFASTTAKASHTSFLALGLAGYRFLLS